MSLARLVVTAVRVEGRSRSEVAREYQVSRRWVQKLVARIVAAQWDELRAGRSRLCLAVASPNRAVQQLRALAEIARSADGDVAFRAEVARPRRTNAAVRARLVHVDTLVRAARAEVAAEDVADAELAWRLLASLQTRRPQAAAPQNSDLAR